MTNPAEKNIQDWLAKVQAEGFTGGVTVLTEGSEGRSADIREIGDKTLENVTKIPRELTPYIAQIFEERNLLNAEQIRAWKNSDLEPTDFQRQITRKYNEVFEANPEQYPSLNAIMLPYAIENIRTRLATEGAQHETTDSNAGQASGAVAAPEAGTPAEGKT